MNLYVRYACSSRYTVCAADVCVQVGPKSVEGIQGPEQGLYPDALRPTTAWAGSGTAADKVLGPSAAGIRYFNPFASVQQGLRVDTFTEQLASVDPSMSEVQWAMPVHATDTDNKRSNLPIANQHLQPHWLSKPAWLAFGSMRSYPLGQLRRLCEALHDRLLPWSQPAVGALVRQTLYQVGELVAGDGDDVRMLWRTGWDQPGDVLQVSTDDAA